MTENQRVKERTKEKNRIKRKYEKQIEKKNNKKKIINHLKTSFYRETSNDFNEDNMLFRINYGFCRTCLLGLGKTSLDT